MYVPLRHLEIKFNFGIIIVFFNIVKKSFNFLYVHEVTRFKKQKQGYVVTIITNLLTPY